LSWLGRPTTFNSLRSLIQLVDNGKLRTVQRINKAGMEVTKEDDIIIECRIERDD
jgi:hypothetical protein